jgi:F-type H+-transporting ATPase subunit b
MNIPIHFIASAAATEGHAPASSAAPGSPAALIESFGVNAPNLLAQVIVFTILLLILWKFAYGPILQVLADRKQRIADSMDQAEKAKQALADADQTRTALLAKANEQAAALITEAQQSAALLAEKKAQEAVAQAEEIIRKAREATELDRARMMAELRGELGRLVTSATARVIGRELSPADQERLVREAARDLAA